jgi:hypothetical protein
MLYWILPNGSNLAFVPRTGSTAWATAILTQFYPGQLAKWQAQSAPAGYDAAPIQFFVPPSKDPAAGALLAVTRNPLDRFCSGFSRAANGLTVDELIAKLRDGTCKNLHVWRISDQIPSNQLSRVQWYRWDRDLPALATACGLSAVPSLANDSDPANKPVLTDAQVALLQTYYAADIATYNACAAAGTVVA